MTNKKYDLDFVEDIVAEVKNDYNTRREERRHFEAQWQLNSNFLSGNQYCTVSITGSLNDCDKDYYWQEREVFNHIAFIVETRLAKLSKVRPRLSVRPSGGDEDDIKAASVSSKILSSASSKLNINDILMKGTQWSETAGSVFYKVSWDKNSGKKVGIIDGSPVCEGEIRIDVCPPYEIFPDSITNQDIGDCASIIHAKAVNTDDIFSIWGKYVAAEDVEISSLSGAGMSGGLGMTSAMPKTGRNKRDGYAVVIERYTVPSAKHPNGELVIVAGNQLLYYGDLPYRCGADGEYAIPFIKQDSLVSAGCFFGTSMIERAIPIQRAYNAVKNRKHEFLNRLAMGVLAVEDGSVDIENLETEGLSPGKILVYRQGSTPPRLLDAGSVPADFASEEDKLLNEFIMVSGVSEVMRSSKVSSVSSGTALQLLFDQDDTRLSATAERIRLAAREMARFIIRLYKQFALQPRLNRCVGKEGAVELVGWKSSDLSSDDVVFDTENELNDSLSSRRNMALELLRTGLLHDQNGKLSDGMRFKLLDVLGYGTWENLRDEDRLHTLKVERENAAFMRGKGGDIFASAIDNHAIHISEHKKTMLSAEYEKLARQRKAVAERLAAHIAMHESMLKKEDDERPSENPPVSPALRAEQMDGKPAGKTEKTAENSAPKAEKIDGNSVIKAEKAAEKIAEKGENNERAR